MGPALMDDPVRMVLDDLRDIQVVAAPRWGGNRGGRSVGTDTGRRGLVSVAAVAAEVAGQVRRNVIAAGLDVAEAASS